MVARSSSFFFFFNDTATTEIYTLSLHDALPISGKAQGALPIRRAYACSAQDGGTAACEPQQPVRSEEHTSELQSHSDLVCRLLLEKKKNNATAADVPVRKHPPALNFIECRTHRH